MARAPFSIEWLSQSSRRPLGPCSSSGDTPTHSGPAPSELSGKSPQPGMSFPGLWSLPATPPALAGSLPGHRTPETGRRVYDQLSPLSHLVPQKTFAAGGADSGYESETCRSDCLPSPGSSPDKDSRRCPSPVAPQPEEEDTSFYPAECARGLGKEGALYTVDPSAIRQGRSSVSPPDCASPPEEGGGLYDCGSPQQEEGSSAYPQEEGSSAYPQEGEDEEGRVSRRLRTAFSSEQIGSLERTFKRQRYLSAFERRKLAARLQLSEVQLKTWFQNRRMKLKRQLQDQQPDPFAQPPFLGGLPYGQQVYPSFYQYAAAGALPAARSPSRLVPSLYPLDPYAGYMQHPAAFGYF